MEKILGNCFNKVYHILLAGWRLLNQLIDRVIYWLQDDRNKFEKQIQGFTQEFNTLIPKKPGWNNICEDINVILINYIPQLNLRQQALRSSLDRVSRTKRILNKKPNRRAEQDREFIEKNLALLNERIVETDQLIETAFQFLSLIESRIIAHMDQEEAPESLHEALEQFLSEIKLTGLEDTSVRDDITTEIDGFKQEKE